MSYGFKVQDGSGRAVFTMASLGTIVLASLVLGNTSGWSATYSYPEVTGRDVRVVIAAGHNNITSTVTYPSGIPTVTITVNATSGGQVGVAYVIAK